MDATDIVRGVYHVSETIPAKSGTMTLRSTKWLPGHHSPSGRIDALVGLVVSASGKALPWVRDADDLWAFKITVPSGATEVLVRFDFMTPLKPTEGRVSMTPSMLELEWDMAVLYPAGPPAPAIPVTADVKLPEGWAFATALPLRTPDRHEATFATTDLATLIDSPVLAAPRLQTTGLGNIGGADVRVHLAEDVDGPSVMTETRLSAYREMVRQLGLVFRGRPPFAHYNLLLTVSDELGGIGWEHLQSSEVGLPTSMFRTSGGQVLERITLPHEFIHAWNGKYRRPEGLKSPDFAKPMSGDLLWVYEGLTQYYAIVISTRSGLISEAETRDYLAAKASLMSVAPGRRWRTLADTGYQAAISPLHNPVAWPDLRRNPYDYYDEGSLVWLEVDAKIRTLTHGRKSLDDFATLFFRAGGPTLDPKFYDLGEVVTALNSVAPFDWAEFFKRRIYDVRTEPPTEGIEAAGWRLIHDSSPPAPQAGDILDLTDAIGLSVNSHGEVGSVRWDGPASRAGLTPGATIVALDGAPFSLAAFRDRVAQRVEGPALLPLIVKARGRVLSMNLDRGDGLSYPHLARRADEPDLLSEILAAKRDQPQ